MKKIYSVLFVVSLTTMMAACGDDGFRNADKKLSELDGDGLTQLCSDVSDRLNTDELREAGARLACFALSQIGGEQCVDAEIDACVEEFLATSTGDAAGECEIDTELSSSCDATVAEVEDCVNDTLAVFEELADATCADLDVSGGGDPFGAEPASCAALEAKCPGVLVDDTNSGFAPALAPAQ